MKAQLLGLSAAALLVAASATSASPATSSDSRLYADRIEAKAEGLLRAAGIDPQGPRVSVRAELRPDGRLADVRVVQTSGSPDLDRAVAEVLRKALVADAPVGLLDGAVTLNVGQGVGLQAKGR